MQNVEKHAAVREKEKEMEDEEYVFLKRKPRLFLVGDPKELGYEENKKGKITKDSSGVDWSSATDTIASMIFAEQDVPYGLHVAWLGNVLYYVESPRLYANYKEQGYEEFYKLLKQAKNTESKEAINALFEYTEPIKAYEIPEEGTDERVWFNRAVRVWEADAKMREEKTKKVTEGIKKIMKAHLIGKVELELYDRGQPPLPKP